MSEKEGVRNGKEPKSQNFKLRTLVLLQLSFKPFRHFIQHLSWSFLFFQIIHSLSPYSPPSPHLSPSLPLPPFKMQSSFLSLLILSICFSSTLINLTFASNSLSIKHNPLDSILGPDGKLTKTAKSKVQSRFKSSSHSSKRALIDEPQRSTSLRSRDQQQQRAEFVNESKRQQQSQNERGLISDLVGGVVGAAHSALHDSLSWRDDNGWGIAVAETENDEIDNEVSLKKNSR